MRWWLIPVALCTMAAPVRAQGWIDPVRPVPDFGVQKLRTAVSVRVTGRVATVEVEEWFRNDGPALGEGDYLYPLPGEAVFSNFSLFQGDQELRGETMDSRKARAIYEQIVRQKKDPALIELAGHGLLRARVFPIAAGETRKITLRYTQMLARAGDALQFKYAAGSRTAGQMIVRGRDIAPVVNRPRSPLSFTLTIDDASNIGDPFSPTHEVQVQRSGRRVTVRPENELVGDFDVFMPLLRSGLGMTVITHKPSSEPGFFMLTLSPGKTGEQIVPRDVSVVLDVSGSMSGEKMEQARSALRSLLESLSPNDRFRLIAFSDQVRTYRRDWVIASRADVEKAQDWIDALRAEGGTNIAGALDEAFEATSPAARLPFVIFITDGLPSVGEQNPERIAQRAETSRGRARVFTFGVGYDVNTYLLDRLSAAAKGTTQFVRPGENVERAVGTLATKIRFPVLADLRIGNSPVRIDEVYPVQLPDLFANEELIITGRYRGAGSGTIVLHGSRAGRAETFSTSAQFSDHELNNDYIPKIWAARKVGYLSQKLKLGSRDPETLQQLKETALRYGILTEYTSYLVLEPGVTGDLAATGAASGSVAMPEARKARNSAAAVAAAPPPPAAQSGRGAVASADAARVHREAKTSSAVEEAAAGDSRDRADHRTVGGRSFRNANGAWIDMLHRDDQKVVTVEPFSAAYFALLSALPELEPYFKSFTAVTVAGKTISVKVAAGGSTELDATRVATIVKGFRN